MNQPFTHVCFLSMLITFSILPSAHSACLDALPFTAGWGMLEPGPNGWGAIPSQGWESWGTYYHGSSGYSDGVVTAMNLGGASLIGAGNAKGASIHVKDMTGNYAMGMAGGDITPDRLTLNNGAAIQGELNGKNSNQINDNIRVLDGNPGFAQVPTGTYGYSLAVMMHQGPGIHGPNTYYLDFYTVNTGTDGGGTLPPGTLSTLYNGSKVSSSLTSYQALPVIITYTTSVQTTGDSLLILYDSNSYTTVTEETGNNAFFLNPKFVINEAPTAPTGSLTVDKNMVGQNGQVTFNWSVTPTE